MSKRPVRARLVAAVAGLALVVGAWALAGTVGATDGRPARLLQLNLCGHACPATSAAKVRSVVGSLRAFRPAAVSLDEVCRPQLRAVVAGLATAAWAMHAAFLVTRPGGCGGGVDYGIAVLTRAPVVDTDRVRYAAQEPDRVELRGLLCVAADLAGRRSRVCTTHLLDSGNDPRGVIRTAQVAAAAAYLRTYDVPVVLMGDLNLRPGDTALDPLYRGTGNRGLVEVGQGPGGCRCGAATRGATKLDYVFLTARDFRVRRTTTVRSPVSDHRQLRAWVTAR